MMEFENKCRELQAFARAWAPLMDAAGVVHSKPELESSAVSFMTQDLTLVVRVQWGKFQGLLFDRSLNGCDHVSTAPDLDLMLRNLQRKFKMCQHANKSLTFCA